MVTLNREEGLECNLGSSFFFFLNIKKNFPSICIEKIED